MVSFFENTSKNVKPTKKHVKSPPKLIIPVQMQQRIIMPKGGIPKDYYASASSSQNPRPKSPRYVRNVELSKPQKLDKEKIKNNMQNMKQLLEKKGIYKRPFIIEPPNYNQMKQQENLENNENNESNENYSNQINKENQENKDNQISKENQENKDNQINQKNQENKDNQINKENQENKDNQIYQKNQVKQENNDNKVIQDNKDNQENKNNKIEQVNQNNQKIQKAQKNKNNQVNKIEGLFSHNQFLAAKSIFETRNNEAINKNYQNKPLRKDIKKKAKSAFEE